MIGAIFQMYQLSKFKLEVHIEWTTIKHNGKKNIFGNFLLCTFIDFTFHFFFWGRYNLRRLKVLSFVEKFFIF